MCSALSTRSRKVTAHWPIKSVNTALPLDALILTLTCSHHFRYTTLRTYASFWTATVIKGSFTIMLWFHCKYRELLAPPWKCHNFPSAVQDSNAFNTAFPSIFHLLPHVFVFFCAQEVTSQKTEITRMKIISPMLIGNGCPFCCITACNFLLQFSTSLTDIWAIPAHSSLTNLPSYPNLTVFCHKLNLKILDGI